MVKVIESRLKQNGKTSVTEKRIKSSSGKFVVHRTIDADSPTFSSDMSYVFRKNVAKARRAKK